MAQKYFNRKFAFGLAINFILVSLLLVLDLTRYRIPSAPGFFSTVVILLTFHYGIAIGLVSAFTGVVFAAFHFAIPGTYFSFANSDNSARAIMWLIMFPLQAIFLGILKERLLKKIESEKLLQQKLLATSKLVAAGELAAGLSHEINTPLTAMILNAEMIILQNEAKANTNPEITKRAVAIATVGHKISKIVEGLKIFSQESDARKKSSFFVKDLIDTTIDLCHEKFASSKVEIIVKPDLLNTTLHGQIDQLSLMLLNLFNNSLDAIKDLPEKWIRIETRLQQNYLELSVTDSGNGICKNVRDRIFFPFFTTKDIGQGVGLGLSVSTGIVQNHGGTLSYDDSCKNTRFLIQLPYNLSK